MVGDKEIDFLGCASLLPLYVLECNDSCRCVTVLRTTTTPSTEVPG